MVGGSRVLTDLSVVLSVYFKPPNTSINTGHVRGIVRVLGGLLSLGLRICPRIHTLSTLLLLDSSDGFLVLSL